MWQNHKNGSSRRQNVFFASFFLLFTYSFRGNRFSEFVALFFPLLICCHLVFLTKLYNFIVSLFCVCMCVRVPGAVFNHKICKEMTVCDADYTLWWWCNLNVSGFPFLSSYFIFAFFRSLIPVKCFCCKKKRIRRSLKMIIKKRRSYSQKRFPIFNGFHFSLTFFLPFFFVLFLCYICFVFNLPARAKWLFSMRITLAQMVNIFIRSFSLVEKAKTAHSNQANRESIQNNKCLWFETKMPLFVRLEPILWKWVFSLLVSVLLWLTFLWFRLIVGFENCRH